MTEIEPSESEPQCLFCQIVAGTVPSQAVAGTENTYAFEDIAPAAPVHILVVPRQHIADARDLSLDHGGLLAEMINTAQAVAKSNGIAESGYRLVINVGEDALNSVPHLHIHVLGGRTMGWPPG